MVSVRGSATSPPLVTLVLLWLVGLYLRLPILVAPPLAPAISGELALNQAAIGALTTLPVLMLALGALPGSYAIARLGAGACVAVSLVVLTLASAGRGLAPPVWLLFAATALMGFAIALMQPALPVLVKQWCGTRVALGSAVYMNGLLMGEFVGAGLTLPVVMPWLDGDWRATLTAWSLPALLVAAAVAARSALRHGPDGSAGVVAWNPPWRQGRVWKLGLLLGAASAGFFGTNAYMGPVLTELGRGSELGRVLFVFNATQVVGSLLMIVLGGVLVGRRWPVIVVACGLPLGLLGFASGSPGVFLPAVVILGLCTCVQLILMVSLVPMVASERAAGPLAAGMFAVGYLLGFAVPLAGGVLADLSGIARMALVPMGVLALAAMAVAVGPSFGHGSQREDPID